MRKLTLGLLTMVLTCTYITCSAITVSVDSTNENIVGLGFTVNGKKHGGPGHSYSADNMPKGSYNFGVRKKGKDIPCLTANGKRSIKLKADTKVTLMFDDKKCQMKVNS